MNVARRSATKACAEANMADDSGGRVPEYTQRSELADRGSGKKRGYRPPTLEPLGSVADLTQGATGSVSDLAAEQPAAGH